MSVFSVVNRISVILLLINYGLFTGWPSPNFSLLTSAKSPLPTGQITTDEISCVAAVLPIGALLGTPIFGLLMNLYGRKLANLFISIPLIISWLLICFARNVYFLYVARVLQGVVTGGILMASPVYLVEIASDNVRGILLSVGAIGAGIGIEIAYILGNFCGYYVTPIYGTISTIIFAVLFWFLPETPIFLVKQKRITEAKNSLRFYRSIPPNSEKYILSEIEKIRNSIGALESKKCDGERLKWTDFTIKPGSRAMIIATFLILLNQFSGVTAMLSYTATIFRASGSAMSPNTSAMIVGIIKMLGTFVVTPLIDRSGRKFLFIASAVGTTFGQIVLGVYMMLRSNGYAVEAYNWIPILSFSFAVFVSAFALQGLPISVTAELLPIKMKDIGLTYTVSLMMILYFFVLKFLPLLAETYGFHVCMFLSATTCLLGTAFVIKFLPETKNKSYEEIMN